MPLRARYTASTWPTLASAQWESIQRANGLVTSADGTIAPKTTHAEALSLVDGWRRVPGSGFGDWYAYAAHALNGKAGEPLDADVSVMLWVRLAQIAAAVDSLGHAPEMTISRAAFTDQRLRSEVATAMEVDGGDAAAALRIPLPACRDPKTGRPESPAQTARRLARGGKCEPVTIGNPIDRLVRGAIIVGALYVALHLADNAA